MRPQASLVIFSLSLRGAHGSRPPIWRRRGRGARARRACTARPGCRCRSTRASRTCTTASARGGRESPRTFLKICDRFPPPEMHQRRDRRRTGQYAIHTFASDPRTMYRRASTALKYQNPSRHCDELHAAAATRWQPGRHQRHQNHHQTMASNRFATDSPVHRQGQRAIWQASSSSEYYPAAPASSGAAAASM